MVPNIKFATPWGKVVGSNSENSQDLNKRVEEMIDKVCAGSSSSLPAKKKKQERKTNEKNQSKIKKKKELKTPLPKVNKYLNIINKGDKKQMKTVLSIEHGPTLEAEDHPNETKLEEYNDGCNAEMDYSENVEVEISRNLSDKELADIAKKQFDDEMKEYEMLQENNNSEVKSSKTKMEDIDHVINPQEVGLKKYKYERAKQSIKIDDFSDFSDSEYDPSESNPEKVDSEQIETDINDANQNVSNERYVPEDTSTSHVSGDIRSSPKKNLACEIFQVEQDKVTYKCSKCERGFAYLKYMLNHEKVCGTMYKCYFCAKEFTNKNNRLKHKQNVHCKHSCPYGECEQTFTTKKQLKTHIKHLHTKNFKCELCGKVFEKSGGLRSHKFKHHNKKKKDNNETPKEKRILVCQACPKVFSTTQGLRKHMKCVHLSTK